MMQDLLSNVKLNEDKVKVVGNIINVDSVVRQGENYSPLIHEFGKYIVVVGRLIGIKNFQLALKTLKALDPVYNLVIIGEGEKEGELREIAKILGITERVKFAGFLDNPYPVMRGADLCLLTSLIEGFPNTLLEMMALNPRIISTRCVAAIENIPFVQSCFPEEEEVFIELTKKELKLSYNTSKLLNQQRYLREHHSIMNFMDLIYEDSTSR
jgi:glycosyltransferase involved in cell wall biosynthesis